MQVVSNAVVKHFSHCPVRVTFFLVSCCHLLRFLELLL